MAELLTLSKQHQWVVALTSTLNDSEIKPNLERFVLSLYGGMGSLNDIVLYVDGEANSEVNDEFDDLRTKVFELCCKAL
jgi:hypothetical protein